MMRASRDGGGALLACAGLILFLSLGTRQGFGLFLQPMTFELGWSREAFSFAIALQNLVWGLAQPFAGAVADRQGAGRVLIVGGLLYALGLVAMAFARSPLTFDFAAGVLVGMGLAGCSFGVVMGVTGRTVAPERLGTALGIVGAGGSLGQFAMLPYAATLIGTVGWQTSLLILSASTAGIVPLALGLAGAPQRVPASSATPRSLARTGRGRRAAMWCLTLSLLVCGFQTTFIMVHLPAFLVDQGMSPRDGMTALATVGLFNIVGSFLWGYLGDRLSKKALLIAIYLIRAVALAIFVLLPLTAVTLFTFAAVIGFTWLGTVPLTNGLVADLYGRRLLATLFSITFLGHQIGAFLGVWSGGYLFDLAGSYAGVWWLAIVLSLIAAAVCAVINERRPGALAQAVAA